MQIFFGHRLMCKEPLFRIREKSMTASKKRFVDFESVATKDFYRIIEMEDFYMR
jgi:hypothetical protein